MTNQYKLIGKRHADAHREAYVAELLAAKSVFQTPLELLRYLKSRVEGYPDGKIPNPEEVVGQLERVLMQAEPRKSNLLQCLEEHRL